MGEIIDISLPGSKHRIPFFRFSKDETESLFRALKKFDKKQAEGFVQVVAMECLCFPQQNRQPGRAQQAKELKFHIARFEAVENSLLQILRGFRPELVFDFWQEGVNAHNRYSELMTSSEKALAEIKNIKKYFKESLEKTAHGKGGQHKDYLKDFVIQIAKTYERFFHEKPTNYKGGREVGTGLFFNVVETILEAVGLPSEDHSRIITSALKSL